MAKPSGFTCRCGSFNMFPGWVFAHWDIGVRTSCADCGRMYRVIEGVATPDWNEVGDD